MEFTLTDSQRKALSLISSGKNAFITGPAGCGKTFLINYFVSKFKESRIIAVTSTTGTSALHINGTTIHSWAGLGVGTASAQAMLTKIKKKRWLRERWFNVNTLIIDEISMLDPELFEKIDFIAKKMKRSQLPFGGIQLILTGDFLQLPVVNCPDFCFETKVWGETISKDNIVYMHENMRQQDKIWRHCLSEIRMGEVSKETESFLEERVDKDLTNEHGILPTKLFPLNMNVDEINYKALAKLSKKHINVYEYEMDCNIYNPKLQYILEKFKKNCSAVDTLQLTQDCQVILLINLDFDIGLVNGSRGIVTGFVDDLPVVKFLNGITRIIDYHIWEIEDKDTKLASIEQIPLRLGYAFSIHRAQGCTLDFVITDLGNVFEYGQAYVALGRVKNLEGLSIRNLDIKRIKANPKAKLFYQELNK